MLTTKTRRLVMCVIAVSFLGAFLIGYLGMRSLSDKMAQISIGSVDLNLVRDGQYEGEYDGELVKVRVWVTVADHRITDLIILKHEHGLGGKAESIIESVINRQSLSVEVVSGATHSSKALLKATEIALLKGIAP